jgi:dTDP-glucose 4,6-dehydratase
MNNSVYLITGGCGFIGSHIIDELLDNHKNIQIINVDFLGVGSDKTNVRSDDRVANHYINICDPEIFNIVEKYKPDFVIHCAAESHVDRSITDPLSFITSNVLGTANLLEAVRLHAKNARIVHVSTDEVYGHLGLNDPPFTESSQINPRSPYSASKAGSDFIALSYRNTYKLCITVTRCCNNYGPRQHNEKLIPTIIKSVVSGKKVPIYGNGSNIREWIYVTDHAKAIIEILHCHNYNPVYNIFGKERLTNLEITKQIISELVNLAPEYNTHDNLDDYITFVEDRKGHDFRYAMDTNYTDVMALDYQNSFHDGILSTLEYYLHKYIVD